jgi:hypothetical protein
MKTKVAESIVIKRGSCARPQGDLYLLHQLGDAQFLVQDVIRKLIRRQMLKVHFPARVLAVEIAVHLEHREFLIKGLCIYNLSRS